MFKRFLHILVVTLGLGLLAQPIYARGKFFGYVNRGGSRVNTSGQLSSNKVQVSYPGATVKVCVASTGCSATAGTLAILYSDAGGTPLGNPLTAGTDGTFTFWTDTSTFDLVFYGPGITTQCGSLFPGYPCISAFTWAGMTWTGSFGTNTGAVSLRSFGGIGDGVTPEDTAVAAWLSYCNANAVACYAPAGRYVLTTNPINWTWNGTALTIYGDGLGATFFINKLSAGKSTFQIDSGQYFTIHDIGIIGVSGFPNDGMEFKVNAGGTSCGCGGTVYNILLTPNGNGIHLNGTAVGAFGGINTYKLENILYWPSGYNGGASQDAGNRKHAILADGAIVNDVHIDKLNSTGIEYSISGAAGVKWNTTSTSQNISIRGMLNEGITTIGSGISLSRAVGNPCSTVSPCVVTVTKTGHGFAVGDVVNLSASSVADYNGWYTITATPTADTFTFDFMHCVTPATPATTTLKHGNTAVDIGGLIPSNFQITDSYLESAAIKVTDGRKIRLEEVYGLGSLYITGANTSGVTVVDSDASSFIAASNTFSVFAANVITEVYANNSDFKHSENVIVSYCSSDHIAGHAGADLANSSLRFRTVIATQLQALDAGSISYCTDCKNSVDNAVVVGAVCVGGGNGALAVRINGSWRCY